MKEIIKKIIIAVVVIAVVGAVAGFALRSDEPEVTTSGTSSSDISTSGPDNSVNATTGNQVNQPSQQEQNPQGTTASQNQQDTTNAYAPSQQGTQPSQQEQNPQGTTSSQNQQDTTNGYAPSQQNTQPSQSQPGTDASQPTSQNPLVPQPPQQDTQPPQQVNKIDTYQQIFRSGKFIMKVNDPDLGDVTMAMNGNKMFVEASMEGITLKMLYDGDKPDADNPATGTWYIVIDKIKKYSPMPADMLGDMNVEDITKDFAKGDSNTVYTKSVETVNGEQLDCESCVDSNGNTTKYYFRGDTLVRSDSISPSGEVSTTEFREISGTVDESLFVIPSGYAKWDISWLMNAMG